MASIVRAESDSVGANGIEISGAKSLEPVGPGEWFRSGFTRLAAIISFLITLYVCHVPKPAAGHFLAKHRLFLMGWFAPKGAATKWQAGNAKDLPTEVLRQRVSSGMVNCEMQRALRPSRSPRVNAADRKAVYEI